MPEMLYLAMSVHALHFLFLVFFPSRNTSNFFFYSLFITDCWPMTYLYLSSLKNFKCFIFIVWVFLLAHMSVYRGLLPIEAKRGCLTLWNWSYRAVRPLYGCKKPNWGPLEEQTVFFTTEPPLQLLSSFTAFFW